jgi:DNA-nicking Smr family endonuclease
MLRTLDLHGVKHSEVPRLVDQFLWEQINKKSREAEIITGLSTAMREIVINNLKDYDYTYNDEFKNPGKIVVKLV